MVLYHEFDHAEETSLGDGFGSPSWILPWDADDKIHDKEEVYANLRCRELHAKADSLDITLPPERLGIFDGFIRRYKRYVSNALGSTTSSISGRGELFDDLRMMKYGLHHSKRYLKAIQRYSAPELGSFEPVGVTVVDRIGRKHVYYRHEELKKCR